MSESLTEHLFDLIPGEIVKIGGILYEYMGAGTLRGATDPALARGIRDGLREQAGGGEADSGDGINDLDRDGC